MPPESLYTEYQKLLLKNIWLYSKRIQRLYNNAIVEVSLSAATIDYRSEIFTLDLYPAIRKKIDQVLQEMQNEMVTTINQATKEAWTISNKKNDIITKAVLGKRSLPANVTDEIFNPNLAALTAFQTRKELGLDLSRRIWNLIKPFRHELEAGLADGINNGRSASTMASTMKRYLNEPDKLFRRVRDKKGQLQLSRAARAYNPGQGVYRSSYKNALRLTRTETNMSYRNADIERWRKLPFVTGFKINTSNNHPKFDICDELKGVYPKTFNWPGGWHPQCLCYLTPEMITEDQADQMEDSILGINKGPEDYKVITDVPQNFKDYIKENSDRIAGWKNKPYWVRDNLQFLKGEIPAINYTDSKTLNNNVNALDYVPGTNVLFTDKTAKSYNPSRLLLHDKIVNDYLSNGSSNKGISYFMGGAPATGKSSLLSTGLVKLPKDILVIDPDKIKGMLPEYNEMIKRGNTKAAAKVHEESSTLSKSITKSAADRGFDIVADGVGDGSYEKVVAKVKQQRDAGKKVIAEYVTTDTETSVKRAMARAKKTGREVPETYIRSMHKEISNLIPKFVENKIFDELRVYNNDGEKPVLIFEQIGDKITIYDQKLWEKFLRQGD